MKTINIKPRQKQNNNHYNVHKDTKISIDGYTLPNVVDYKNFFDNGDSMVTLTFKVDGVEETEKCEKPKCYFVLDARTHTYSAHTTLQGAQVYRRFKEDNGHFEIFLCRAKSFEELAATYGDYAEYTEEEE